MLIVSLPFLKFPFKLTEEVASAHSETVSVREQWFEVFEDMQREFDQKLAFSKRIHKLLEKRALKAEKEVND